MNLANNLFALATSLLLAATATAQSRSGQVTQQRGSSYSGVIGNSNLGGSVAAHSLLTTSTGLMGDVTTMSIGGNATVNLLGYGVNLALVSATSSNGTSVFTIPRYAQARSGNVHVQMIGYDLINRNFSSDTVVSRQTWNFNAYGPNGVSASFPCGPVSVTIRGNVGAGLTMAASYGLPAGTLSVSAGGSVTGYGFANAAVGFGVPGFNLGCVINGHILEQNLTMLCGATVGSGFFGSVSYSLAPTSLTLYAYVEAFWQRWTTNLASWLSGAVNRLLF